MEAPWRYINMSSPSLRAPNTSHLEQLIFLCLSNLYFLFQYLSNIYFYIFYICKIFIFYMDILTFLKKELAIPAGF